MRSETMSSSYSKTAGSSSRTLRHFEQAHPSVRENVQRRAMQAVNQKPLPPIPLQPHSSPYDIQRKMSHSPSPPPLFRRPSSVYSQNSDGWAPDTTSWRSADLADTNFFLQPVVFSASSPALVQKEAESSPKSITIYDAPSLNSSRSSLHNPFKSPLQSALLPPPIKKASTAKTHARTVSLEEAWENMRAPGAEQMLPEELRARVFQASLKGSSGHLVRSSTTGLLSAEQHQIANITPRTFVDMQGRDRLVHATPNASTQPLFFQPYHDLQSQYNAIKLGRGPEKTMAPIADQARDVSKSKAAQALGLDSIAESRSRAKPTRLKSVDYSPYWSADQRSSESSSEGEGESEENETAKEYHSFLLQQSRQPSPAAGSNMGTDIVPAPLFRSGKKPKASTNPQLKSPSSIISSGHSHSSSGSHNLFRSSLSFFRDAANPEISSPPKSSHSARSDFNRDQSRTSASNRFPAQMSRTASETNGGAMSWSPPPPPSSSSASTQTSPTKLLGMMTEGWRANQARKRREELKKRIRVVAETKSPGGGGGGGEGGFF